MFGLGREMRATGRQRIAAAQFGRGVITQHLAKRQCPETHPAARKQLAACQHEVVPRGALPEVSTPPRTWRTPF